MTPFEKTFDELTRDRTESRFTSATLYEVGRRHGLTYKEVQTLFINDVCRVARGLYDVRLCNEAGSVAPATNEQSVADSETGEASPTPPVSAEFSLGVMEKQKTFADIEEVFIPAIDNAFVPWGEYNDVRKIVASKMFFPTFISGLSGNGKTLMVEQACAREKREYVRIQISPETDESELIGGFRLIAGETVFYKGPVIKAMERGAVLLIDEIDRGSNKIMCLQGVLEGKPILIKKIGQIIKPAPGFNVIATANTKGRGSEDGRYSAATVIDEAFLERFVITIDQPYPDIKIEKSIILKHCQLFGVKDEVFVDKLVAWAQIIRKTYEGGGVEECISTRRLCHVVRAYSIFKERHKSIAKCIARFDETTRDAFSDLYTKVDNSPIVQSDSDD